MTMLSSRGARDLGCFILFVAPFGLVGGWLLRGRLDTRRELVAIGQREATAAVAGATGPVRLVGTLDATTPVRSAGGTDAVWTRTTVRRLERGGGARLCDERAVGAALRMPSGELVSLEAMLDAQTIVDGARPEKKAALPVVRIHRGAIDETPLDSASTCPGPPPLAGRVATRELALPQGQPAIVLACATGGAVAPCGDGADALVVGTSLAALRDHVAREPEQAVLAAAVHLVLLSVLGFASLLGLPSRRARRRVDVVRN